MVSLHAISYCRGTEDNLSRPVWRLIGIIYTDKDVLEGAFEERYWRGCSLDPHFQDWTALNIYKFTCKGNLADLMFTLQNNAEDIQQTQDRIDEELRQTLELRLEKEKKSSGWLGWLKTCFGRQTNLPSE